MTTDAPAAAVAPAAPSRHEVRRQAIVAFAAILNGEDFGAGALASLRRNDPTVVLGQPAFHRLTSRLPEEELKWPDDRVRWATVVHAMAIGATPGRGVSAVPAGRAFQDAGLAEARFSRLMAARGDRFRDQVVLLARYLHAKDTPFSWRDLGELVLVEDRNEDRAATLRYRLAQGFYNPAAS